HPPCPIRLCPDHAGRLRGRAGFGRYRDEAGYFRGCTGGLDDGGRAGRGRRTAPGHGPVAGRELVAATRPRPCHRPECGRKCPGSGAMKPAVLILGATGTIGRGAVKAAVESGWPVVAVARDAQALEELRRRYPDAPLQVLPGSVSDDAGAAELVAALQ